MQPENKFYVYIIGSTLIPELDKGYYKVGYSKDFEARIRMLSTSSPQPLKIYKKFEFETEDMARCVEQTTHDSLASVRGNGEWFLETLEVVTDAVTWSVVKLASEKTSHEYRAGLAAAERYEPYKAHSLTGWALYLGTLNGKITGVHQMDTSKVLRLESFIKHPTDGRKMFRTIEWGGTWPPLEQSTTGSRRLPCDIFLADYKTTEFVIAAIQEKIANDNIKESAIAA